MISSLIASDASTVDLSNHSSHLRRRNIVPAPKKKGEFSQTFLEMDMLLKQHGLLDVFQLSEDELESVINLVEGKKPGTLDEVVEQLTDLIKEGTSKVSEKSLLKKGKNALNELDGFGHSIKELTKEEKEDKVKRIYRDGALVLHPDKVADGGAMFQSLSGLIEILKESMTEEQISSLFDPDSYNEIIALTENFEKSFNKDIYWIFHLSDAHLWRASKKDSDKYLRNPEILKMLKQLLKYKQQGKEPSKYFRMKYFKSISDIYEYLIRPENKQIDDRIIAICTKYPDIFKNIDWLLLQKKYEDRSSHLVDVLQALQKPEIMKNMNDATRYFWARDALIAFSGGLMFLGILAYLKDYFAKHGKKVYLPEDFSIDDYDYSQQDQALTDFDDPDLLILPSNKNSKAPTNMIDDFDGPDLSITSSRKSNLRKIQKR